MFRHHKIIKKERVIHKNQNIPTPPLLDSTYVPSSIKHYIKTHAKSYLHYSCKIFERKINIYFILFEKNKKNTNYYEESVIRIIMWLRMAFLYSPQYCGKNLKYIYILPHFKKNYL